MALRFVVASRCVVLRRGALRALCCVALCPVVLCLVETCCGVCRSLEMCYFVLCCVERCWHTHPVACGSCTCIMVLSHVLF